jgi:hypothetical protein
VDFLTETLAIHACAQEILAAAYSIHDDRIGRADRADQGLCGRPIHLHFVLAPRVRVMALSLRHTRTRLGSAPAYADRQDFLVIEDGQVIGRIYEDRYVPAEVRWFWLITEYVYPALGIRTRNRVSSLGIFCTVAVPNCAVAPPSLTLRPGTA